MANEKRLIDVNEPLRKIQKEIEKVQVWRNKKANSKNAVLFIDEIYKLDNWLGVYAECADLIAEAPTVDAVEVVHGRWIEDSLIEAVACSLCGHTDYTFNYDKNSWGSNYCPNCGAKMDGGNEDAER